MKKMIPTMMAAGMIVLLAGCSTEVSREAYGIQVSTPKPGTTFKVFNRKGEFVHQGTTPAMIVLPGQSSYFTREHYTFEFDEGKKLQFEANISPWYFANVFTPWGFITEGFTGAMWALPKKIVLGAPQPEWELNL